MSEKTYPYQAWVLMPSFRPKLETFVCRVSYGDDESQSGKWYMPSSIYETKADAIAAGRKILIEQQAKIDKRQANLNRRKAALDKAEHE
jgi:hypothetical protein